MKLLLCGLLTAAALFAQARHIEGTATSPVRVISYEDLQCPDCATYRKLLDAELLPKYGTKVAFEHRDFPLAKHKWARVAAIASRHWDEQQPPLGPTWRKFCYANQAEITPENFNDKVRQFAVESSMDAEKAIAALSDKRLAKLVDDDFQEGVARGVSRTPTVFVNGEPFTEPKDAQGLSKAIDSALAALPKP